MLRKTATSVHVCVPSQDLISVVQQCQRHLWLASLIPWPYTDTHLILCWRFISAHYLPCLEMMTRDIIMICVVENGPSISDCKCQVTEIHCKKYIFVSVSHILEVMVNFFLPTERFSQFYLNWNDNFQNVKEGFEPDSCWIICVVFLLCGQSFLSLNNSFTSL